MGGGASKDAEEKLQKEVRELQEKQRELEAAKRAQEKSLLEEQKRLEELQQEQEKVKAEHEARAAELRELAEQRDGLEEQVQAAKREAEQLKELLPAPELPEDTKRAELQQLEQEAKARDCMHHSATRSLAEGSCWNSEMAGWKTCLQAVTSRPRVTAPCVRPFSAASTPPRVSRFENATPGYGAEHRVLAALAGGCVALRARGQNAVMTLAPVDEKRPDAKLEEVFLVQTPLVLPPPFPASLAQLLPKHAIVAARLATGGFVAFDFTPEAPEDPVGALQLLLGGSVPGRLARRSMARLPRSAVRLGRAKADTTVRAVEAVEAAFEPRLSLGKNDCNSYAEKVLEALLADKQKVLEERLFSTLDWEGEDTQELRYKEPSVLNAVVLVAGTTVGAGILALPAVTQPVGFVPSMAALSFSWIYMAVTGLFIAEVACRTMAATGKRSISLQSMAISSVGQAGAWLSSGAFVFLHMALLIAYCSKGGELLLSLGLAALPIPGPLLFAGIFGGFVFVAKGSEALERGNNAFAIVVV
ncbi:unnamed protein product, partial [Effrenium voratum]